MRETWASVVQNTRPFPGVRAGHADAKMVSILHTSGKSLEGWGWMNGRLDGWEEMRLLHLCCRVMICLCTFASLESLIAHPGC